MILLTMAYSYIIITFFVINITPTFPYMDIAWATADPTSDGFPGKSIVVDDFASSPKAVTYLQWWW